MERGLGLSSIPGPETFAQMCGYHHATIQQADIACNGKGPQFWVKGVGGLGVGSIELALHN